ncbi:MAG: hypothetical protein ACTSUS_02495 [Candidatus Freyarchaeota archaeon]
MERSFRVMVDGGLAVLGGCAGSYEAAWRALSPTLLVCWIEGFFPLLRDGRVAGLGGIPMGVCQGGLGSGLSMLLFLVFGFLHGFCCVGWYLMSTQ